MSRATLDRKELSEHYARILAEQKRTGASMRAVASRYGVSAGNLYWWRRRLRARVDSPCGLLAVDVIDRPRGNGAGALSGAYEIVLANGVSVRAPRDFDVARVSELLAAARAC